MGVGGGAVAICRSDRSAGDGEGGEVGGETRSE